MYESRKKRPLPHAEFVSRMVRHLIAALMLLLVSLGVGMAGYIGLEKLSPLDAFLNSSMLLGGMGPVNLPMTASGKLFAGVYALYSGLVFIVTAALVFTPVIHRVLHLFHWDDDL